MSLVYLCDFCQAEHAVPEPGNQRDPGPFVPTSKGWAEIKGYTVKHIGPLCLAKLTSAPASESAGSDT